MLVAFLVKPGVPEAESTALSMLGTLDKAGVEHQRLELTESKRGPFGGVLDLPLPEDLDLLVTVGGDGTLLLGARLLGTRTVPVLGVNVGRLGFLTDAAPGEAEAALRTFLAGEAGTESRMVLDVELVRQGKQVLAARVLNDAVVSVGPLARLVEVESRIAGQVAHSSRGDGFIVATPTGSTAYSLAAGGPLVHPEGCSILLTPICPHSLSDKPIVVGDTMEVCLKVVRADSGAVLTLDGQVGEDLQEGDQLFCRRSPQDLLLVRTRQMDFFEVLRRKLGWAVPRTPQAVQGVKGSGPDHQ